MDQEYQKRKEEHFKKKSTIELEQELSVLLMMDGNGGLLADDIIEELDRRILIDSKHLREFADLAYDILEKSITYKRTKRMISNVFRLQSDYYFEDVILRLSVIDSNYSTQVGSKRLFGLDDIANQIVEIGTDYDLLGRCQLFLDYPHKRNEITELLSGRYGIDKMGENKGRAASLISKYLYFLMGYEFPIYDSLAIQSYKKIRLKYDGLNLPELRNTFHVSYFETMTNLKKISGIDSFNRLDNLLWLIGKVSQGSMSLILDREPYMELTKRFKAMTKTNMADAVNVDDIFKDFIRNIKNVNGIIGDSTANSNLLAFIDYSMNYFER